MSNKKRILLIVFIFLMLTTYKGPDLISLASLHIPSMSSIATFIHFANLAIPGFPGATTNFFVKGDL